MSFESKDELIFGRQLAAQSVQIGADLVAGTSDLPGRVTIDNSTIGATVITIDITAPLKKCFKADVRDRASSAIIELAAAPDLSVANKISITVDGTAQSDVSIEFVYQLTK